MCCYSNHGQYAAGSWRPFTFRKQTEDIDPLTASQPAFLDVNSTLKEYRQQAKVRALYMKLTWAPLKIIPQDGKRV